MKKILAFLVLAVVAIFSLPVAGVASLAMFPIFSKPTMSVEEIENLTHNFSSFDGEEYDQFSSYDGAGMMALIDTSRVFTITMSVTTTAITNRTVNLFPVLGWIPGRTGLAGMLHDTAGSSYDKTGTAIANFTAAGSPNSIASQRGSSYSPIETLYAYLAGNPTLLNMIKVSSTQAVNCSGSLVYKELSPFRDLTSTIIPLAVNQNEYAYRDKIAQVNLLQYNIIASPQSVLEYTIVSLGTSDTITIELYFAKTSNQTAQLKQQVVGAKQMVPGLSGGSALPLAKGGTVLQAVENNTQRRLV